jgi:uncharacterized protein (DUF488 family)
VKTVYTIGHSNHDQETFLNLLKNSQIEVLVDVRSSPNSKWAEFADRDKIIETLKLIQIQYLYLGDILGGHPSDSDCYDAITGKVSYQVIQKKEYFERGIERLLNGIEKYRVCIMCSEENPSLCHRHLLIGTNLRKAGIKVLHIRGDYRIQTDEELWKEKAGVSSDQPALL